MTMRRRQRKKLASGEETELMKYLLYYSTQKRNRETEGKVAIKRRTPASPRSRKQKTMKILNA